MSDTIADTHISSATTRESSPTLAKPTWIKMRVPAGRAFEETRRAVQDNALQTVCESAQCPNLGECWSQRHMTAMILGNRCTRNCRFCNIRTLIPNAPDPSEPQRVARAVKALGLRNLVITSVDRDDLPDGGAAHWVATIKAIRQTSPEARIEVLIPDFAGDSEALRLVIDTRPEIFGHNLETVPRLYPSIRSAANYRTSLEVLKSGAEAGLRTKTSLMVGLGETDDELLTVLRDARAVGVNIVYIGQYLQPSKMHAPVLRYVPPAGFVKLRLQALEMGFEIVRAAPLLRSSTPPGIADD